MRALFALCLLCSCATAPAQSRFTPDGKPCHAIGYSYNPYWVGPDGFTWCHA
jgi:hypothetical protein